MNWDYSKRRASRYCLFPLKNIGKEFQAGWNDPFASPFEDSYDASDPDTPNTCGTGNTNQEGLCPLHEGLPFQNMTPEAWEHVKVAIRLRREAHSSVTAAWEQVRAKKQARRNSKTDRWNKLVDALDAGEDVNWARTTIEQREQIARSPILPDKVALGLLDFLWPEDATPVTVPVAALSRYPGHWNESDQFGEVYHPGTLDRATDLRALIARHRPPQDQAAFSDEVVSRLFEDPHPVVRAITAAYQRPRSGEDVERLLRDPHTARLVVPRLSRKDREHLGRGLLDPDSGWSKWLDRVQPYRVTIPTYHGLPVRFAAYEGFDPARVDILAGLASRKDASGDLVYQVARSDLFGYTYLCGLARHPQIMDETLDYLAESKWKTVRDAAHEARMARSREDSRRD